LICIGRGDASSQDSRGSKRGQGNFKLAANFGYSSRGSADPRESLRKRRISKLALSAHKVFAAPGVLTTCWILAETGKRTGSFENVGGKGKG
jgi:hypothetical protein